MTTTSIDILAKRTHETLVQRRQQGLERKLKTASENPNLIDLSNNNYFRLSHHHDVFKAAEYAMERYGCSSSSSPLLTGYSQIHHKLEETLKAWYGFPHALIWNSGFTANQAILSKLPQKEDLILADRLIHNSMISGALHSGARLQRYRHLDYQHLGELLEENSQPNRCIFVVTESVFSMDGDYPNLKEFSRLKEQYGFIWIVDEAHGVGWFGETGSGLLEAYHATEQVDIIVGTFSKALGSMGAYTLLRNENFRQYLINFAGEFIYTTYLPPACAAAANAAIELLQSMDKKRAMWQDLSHWFRQQIPQAPDGDSPIVPIQVGNPQRTMQFAEALHKKGFLVGAIRPPTVPDGESRLRISLNSELSFSDLERLSQIINHLFSSDKISADPTDMAVNL